jgi:hypothetical protein
MKMSHKRLALSLLAYNLGNLWRRLGLPRGIENWSLTSLQQRLVKTGGRLVKHSRYYWLVLAEGHLNRRRFGAMLGLGQGEVLQKQGARWGDSGRAGADGRPPGAAQIEESFHNVAIR